MHDYIGKMPPPGDRSMRRSESHSVLGNVPDGTLFMHNQKLA